MIPTFWEMFWEGYFLFQHDCTPVHKARSIKIWLDEFGVEELEWSAQSPDLNPNERHWDELKWRLRAKSSSPASVPDKSDPLQMLYWMNGQTFPQIHSNILWKAFPEDWKLSWLQRATNSIKMSMYLECDVMNVPTSSKVSFC